MLIQPPACRAASAQPDPEVDQEPIIADVNSMPQRSRSAAGHMAHTQQVGGGPSGCPALKHTQGWVTEMYWPRLVVLRLVEGASYYNCMHCTCTAARSYVGRTRAGGQRVQACGPRAAEAPTWQWCMPCACSRHWPAVPTRHISHCLPPTLAAAYTSSCRFGPFRPWQAANGVQWHWLLCDRT